MAFGRYDYRDEEDEWTEIDMQVFLENYLSILAKLKNEEMTVREMKNLQREPEDLKKVKGDSRSVYFARSLDAMSVFATKDQLKEFAKMISISSIKIPSDDQYM